MQELGVQCTVLMAATAQIESSLYGLQQFAVLESLSNDWQKPFRVLQDFFRVRSWVADCDLVHCLVEPLSPLAAMLASQTKGFVFHAVGTHAVAPLDDRMHGLLWRWAYARANHVLCISRYTEERLLERISLNKTSIVPLGVDVSRFAHSQLLHSPNGVTLPWPIILGVGAVKPRKGYHIAIQVIAQLKEHFPHIAYRIVGEIQRETYQEQLEHLIVKLGLEENVKLLGRIDEQALIRQYAECDLFMLLLTNQEKAFDGFGLAYLEANACGKPVIGSLDCGAETAVADGISGFLVPQNDVDTAYRVAHRLLQDRSLYAEMSAAAREWAASMSWDRTVKSVLAVYEQVLECQ